LVRVVVVVGTNIENVGDWRFEKCLARNGRHFNKPQQRTPLLLFLPPVGVGESRDNEALSIAGEKDSPALALALATASKGVSVLVVSASFVDGMVDPQKGRG